MSAVRWDGLGGGLGRHGGEGRAEGEGGERRQRRRTPSGGDWAVAGGELFVDHILVFTLQYLLTLQHLN